MSSLMHQSKALAVSACLVYLYVGFSVAISYTRSPPGIAPPPSQPYTNDPVILKPVYHYPNAYEQEPHKFCGLFFCYNGYDGGGSNGGGGAIDGSSGKGTEGASDDAPQAKIIDPEENDQQKGSRNGNNGQLRGPGDKGSEKSGFSKQNGPEDDDQQSPSKNVGLVSTAVVLNILLNQNLLLALVCLSRAVRAAVVRMVKEMGIKMDFRTSCQKCSIFGAQLVSRVKRSFSCNTCGTKFERVKRQTEIADFYENGYDPIFQCEKSCCDYNKCVRSKPLQSNNKNSKSTYLPPISSLGKLESGMLDVDLNDFDSSKWSKKKPKLQEEEQEFLETSTLEPQKN
uniref:Uncharacterized protein n=1 Tax=Ditylenchus dipsaci TaxID=166011 RepID=A0A915EIP9_9BILA